MSKPDPFDQALKDNVPLQELLAIAKSSARFFVRSMDQLAEDSPSATGRKLTAREALEAYGRDILLEVITEGSALLCKSPTAAGRVIQDRRKLLRLDIHYIASRTGLEPKVVEEAEKSARLAIRDYEKIARALGLDERYISVRPEPVGNESLAVRLRTIGVENPRMTPAAVSAIAEAAWVASTQIRLEEQMGMTPPNMGIEPSHNYGAPGYPAFQHGYFLAQKTRELLKLGTGPLTESLRDLCEDRLGVPLIQAELGEFLAGVTVKAGARRAIVLNRGGRNSNVYVRRSTIAHELGHLLYDVEARLIELQVDGFTDLDKPANQLHDAVEQRANAFAIEFIAPQKAVVECFEEAGADPVGAVMEKFGISITAARNQIRNALGGAISSEALETMHLRPPSPAFEASESYAAYFHPIPDIPSTRAGRFSAVVLRAISEKIISWQSGAEYLRCSEEELHAASDSIREIYPSVFLPNGKS